LDVLLVGLRFLDLALERLLFGEETVAEPLLSPRLDLLQVCWSLHFILLKKMNKGLKLSTHNSGIANAWLRLQSAFRDRRSTSQEDHDEERPATVNETLTL
jgi:hypothetical protein